MNILKSFGFGANNKPTPPMQNSAVAQGPDDDVPAPAQQFAQFGAGCFWGVELAFQRVPGVTKTEVGYTQGFRDNPSYEDVCSGTTNHNEVVRVQYDPKECSFDTLLDVFWAGLDPTTLNRQGNDVGTQYRSGIYYYTPEQENAARESMEKQQKLLNRKIVTELLPAKKFYRAEKCHQQYLAKGATKTTVLNWNQRLQIAVDAAQGLDYLHNGCKPPIVHRDLKPSNILLTENMQAKIADFGLSRAFSMDTSTSSISTALAGTPGYIDPELHASGTLNKKSDVYSFGIILFELITVLPVQITNTEHIMHIVDWVTPMIEEGDIRKIIDPRLGSGFDVNAAWKAVEIAMWCAQRTSKQRPDISQVIAELKECIGRNDQNVQIEMTSLEMASYSYTLPRAR